MFILHELLNNGILRKTEIRRILKRGKRGAATLLPKVFMQNNDLDRGSPLSMSFSPDNRMLFIIVKGTFITFTRKQLKVETVGEGEEKKEKEYSLGMHTISKPKKNIRYPLITLPQYWLDRNNLRPKDKIGIYNTPQKECIVLMKED